MNAKKAAFLNIGISIFFAIAIIVSDDLLEGSPNNQTVMYSLIALWFIPFSYLSAIASKEHQSEKTTAG